LLSKVIERDEASARSRIPLHLPLCYVEAFVRTPFIGNRLVALALCLLEFPCSLCGTSRNPVCLAQVEHKLRQLLHSILEFSFVENVESITKSIAFDYQFLSQLIGDLDVLFGFGYVPQ
jgi:hypothetical protein